MLSNYVVLRAILLFFIEKKG